jgi:hypothetical protein
MGYFTEPDFSPDGVAIAVGVDEQLLWFDRTPGELRGRHPLPGKVASVQAISADR